MTKLLELPHHGRLLVSTDLHGNRADFEALFEVWSQDRDAYWLILGDIVHGPTDEAAQNLPLMCDYPDESAQLVAEIASLAIDYPNVKMLLGNHDWAHVGGPVTRKFWTDEAAHLESTMTPAEVDAMHRFFHAAYLWAWAPNGLFFSHGAAGVPPDDLSLLQNLRFDSRALADRAIMNSAMCSYEQDDATMRRFLDVMGELVGSQLAVLIHGHDRAEDGWYTKGPYQACPVTFGALNDRKAYLDLDLSQRVEDSAELEQYLRRIHP